MNQTTEQPDKFDTWAIVELMGHQKIAGRVTEQSIAGSALLRVDVPDINGQKAYTRFFGAAAIYSINPTTEEIARGMISACSSEPVRRYELPKLADKAEPAGDDDDFGGRQDDDDDP